jgi:hypothetical protein
MTNALAKEFLHDANANQKLCIPILAIRHNASLVAETGEKGDGLE